jgi:hypothetical protein
MMPSMNLRRILALTAILSLSATLARSEPLTYVGETGPGLGKHLVFIASDHEYRSEETLPALARILAKRHGFKCTVLFGLDGNGYIKPGESNIPGIEALDTADLLVIFTRFQDWPADQMRHLVAYLERGGPVVGLRTATHAFKIPADSPYAAYDFRHAGETWKNGFGRAVLGETWAGHHGKNHQQSTRIDIVKEKAAHPILRGVTQAWAECGGYFTDPEPDSEVLAMAQPIEGMKPGGPDVKELKAVPAAWTRTYRMGDKSGRVFTSTYGASGDIVDAGYRRLLINGCLWALGMESAIQPDLEIDFVGPYHPHWHDSPGRRADVKPADLAGWDSPIWPKKP